MKPTAVAATLLLCFALIGCGEKKPEVVAEEPGLKELEVKTVKEGDGMVLGVQTPKDNKVEEGDLAIVVYTGKFKDGKVFDSNMDSEKPPLSIPVGAGMVIPGWDQGLIGMKVGEERTLAVPYALAYGEAGRPPAIPPKSDLFFTIRLLDLVKASELDTYDTKEVKVGTGKTAKKGDVATVAYKGMLTNGQVFDEGEFEFKLGNREAVSGFDAGVEGMKVGGERIIRIPPNLAYGRASKERIPPNSTLVFNLKLLDVQKG